MTSAELIPAEPTGSATKQIQIKSHEKLDGTTMTNLLDCFGQSDRGRRRRVNEDQFLIVDLDELSDVTVEAGDTIAEDAPERNSLGVLLLVADGVGGAQAGDRASAIVANTVLSELLSQKEKLASQEHDDLLRALPEVCHRALVENVARHPEHRGLGTTLTLAHFVWPRLSLVHVGDSRCYLQRNSTIRRLTHDQTMAEYLVDQGLLDPQEAQSSQLRHVLRSVVAGGDCEMQPEVRQLELKPGDRLLLCTNGLTEKVSDDEIREELRSATNAHEACERLIHAAQDAGTTDDTTAVVARLCDIAVPANESAAIHLKLDRFDLWNPVAETAVEVLAG